MKYLKSYHPWEMKVLGGNRKDDIVLPRMTYKPGQLAGGARNVIQLNDAQLAILNQKKIFRNLLGKGKNGGYVLLDELPDSMKTPEIRLAEERAKTARLEKQLAAVKPPTQDKEADDDSEADVVAGNPVTEVKPAMTVSQRQEELKRSSNKDLQTIASAINLTIPPKIKRRELIDMILKQEIEKFSKDIETATGQTLTRMAKAYGIETIEILTPEVEEGLRNSIRSAAGITETAEGTATTSPPSE